METHSSVFLGIVDVLGYSAVEQHLESFTQDSAAALLSNVYNALDQITAQFDKSRITCIRYGDGYVLHSNTQEIEELELLVVCLSRLIALANTQHIPLRVAITQGNIKVDRSKTDGLSITGSGWNRLMELEKSLNWMGGWLYLPNYDGQHYQTISKLVSTTNLVKSQIQCDKPGYTFIPPFKNPNIYQTDRSWFLNWPKLLHQSNEENNVWVDSWWAGIPGFKNCSPDVESKQANTKLFFTYCNIIFLSAKLTFFSGVAPEIDIARISSHG